MPASATCPRATNGLCTFEQVAAGTRLATQTEGDCSARVCNRQGEVTSIDDDEELPDGDGNDCTEDSCSGGAARYQAEPPGAHCAQDSGIVCDGEGACVECILPSQCESGICQEGACRPGMCANETLDPGEADTDCGGVCGRCGVGQLCTQDGDCDSAFCHPTSTECAIPTCDDRFQNGTETAIDCGGTSNDQTCEPCPTCNDNWECDPVVGAGLGLCYEHRCISSVNGCTMANATDLTGMVSASLTTPFVIEFGDGIGNTYAPRCVKVTMGTRIALSGPFTTHPMVGGVVNMGVKQPATIGPFAIVTDTGTARELTLDDCGAYPYYCDDDALSGMTGAVIVLLP